eukprot:TRINITY_DN25010_c0_g1_i1.p1 TRINITY_DN25010_c0_g1~~TRINITY_DN25010_c0_g1_i1.p1  ORF type:complete len:202 (+),score=33.37 TRINITY_DN25010_c0_g1_i1:60-665(+)
MTDVNDDSYQPEKIIQEMGILVGYLEAAMEDEGRSSQSGGCDAIIEHMRRIVKERMRCETETTVGEVVADVSFPSAYDVRALVSPVKTAASSICESNINLNASSSFILDSDSPAMSSPDQTFFTCTSGHPLLIVRVGKEPGCSGFASHKCDLCGTAGLQKSIYRCDICDFDRCITCDKDTMSNSCELTLNNIINHPAYDDL